MKKKMIEFYGRLNTLEYSEENIAELYSIILGLISSLKEVDDNRETNKCLHFVLLTREKEGEMFDSAPRHDWEKNFLEVKRNLLSDLKIYCLQYWNPLQDLNK